MGEIVHAAVGQSEGGGSLLGMLPVMIAMIAMMWFFLFRPERKKQMDHQSMLAALKKGDEVVLSSGLFGKIHAIEDKVVVLEIADKTRVKVVKAQIFGPAARVLQPATTDAKPAAPLPAAAAAADDDKKA